MTVLKQLIIGKNMSIEKVAIYIRLSEDIVDS